MPFAPNPNVRSEVIEFNGRRYRRYPDSNIKAHQRYFGRSGGFLHRDVWEHHNGPIPEGFDVHHIDEDTSNNDIANLACIPRNEHMRTPHVRKDAYAVSEQQREHLARIRPATAAWHQSPEGREWHRKHAANSLAKADRKAWYENLPLTERACEVCGTTFLGKIPKNTLCSRKCADAKQRAKRRDAKLSTPHKCRGCGGEFRSVYTIQLFCGTKCKNAYNKRKRAQQGV